MKYFLIINEQNNEYLRVILRVITFMIFELQLGVFGNSTAVSRKRLPMASLKINVTKLLTDAK